MNRLIALSLIIAAASSVPALADTTGSFAGHVGDYRNQNPISGATVVLLSPSQEVTTMTDANGRFVIMNLVPDRYTIRIFPKWEYDVTFFPAAVDISAGCRQTTRIGLDRRQSTISHIRPLRATFALYPGNCGYDITPRTSPFFANAPPVNSLIQVVPGVQIAGATTTM